MKKLLANIKERIEDVFYTLDDVRKNIKMFCRHSLNKYFFRLLKSTINAVPFDYGSFMEIQYNYLQYMLQHMEKRIWTTDDEYDVIIRWLKRAISMYEIFMEYRDLYHLNGDIDLIPSDRCRGCHTVNFDGVDYVCDVNVNMGNIDRFVPNKKYQVAYKSRPHELYRLKAQYLYFNILNNYLRRLWD